MSRADLCVLIPVAPRYSWLLPILLDCLKKYWPDHPPVIVVEALPEDTTAEGRLCWTQMLQRGAMEARRQGFAVVYLILEEAVAGGKMPFRSSQPDIAEPLGFSACIPYFPYGLGQSPTPFEISGLGKGVLSPQASCC